MSYFDLNELVLHQVKASESQVNILFAQPSVHLFPIWICYIYSMIYLCYICDICNWLQLFSDPRPQHGISSVQVYRDGCIFSMLLGITHTVIGHFSSHVTTDISKMFLVCSCLFSLPYSNLLTISTVAWSWPWRINTHSHTNWDNQYCAVLLTIALLYKLA